LPAPADHLLHPHPASCCPAINAIRVRAEFATAGDLHLHYRVFATPGGLRLPVAQAAGPGDLLWQHTCCEAFMASSDSGAYREFNFSPSGQWAIYDFSDYRQRTALPRPPGPPRLSTHLLDDGFLLQASLPAELLPTGPAWQLGLTVVIEAADGSKSYWALAHAADHPDFHCRSSFILNLSHPTP